MTTAIGTPTVSGLKGAFIDYGVGMLGGLLFAISSGLTGSGLLGGLLGAGLAGSVIKGERGTAIATILGFQTLVGGISQANAQSNNAPEVM